ncbi:MAG: hypothetical protein ABIO04_00280 [Ferruginibacter sp.]
MDETDYTDTRAKEQCANVSHQIDPTDPLNPYNPGIYKSTV